MSVCLHAGSDGIYKEMRVTAREMLIVNILNIMNEAAAGVSYSMFYYVNFAGRIPDMMLWLD